MYLRRRSRRPSRRERDQSIDAGKRQVGVDPGDDFTVRVETIAGGQLVTLTHAIINDAVETLPPDSPSTTAVAVSSAVVSSQPEVVPTTEAPPPASETQEPPLAESEAAFTSEAVFTSEAAATSEAILTNNPESTTFSTSIIPDIISATSAISEADLEPQTSNQEDPDRGPAIGITFGALAGAGLVIGAGVMLYRYKHRKNVRVKTSEMRQFQEI